MIQGDPSDKVLLSKIREQLLAVQKYLKAREIIKKAGLTNADEILAYLGFKVQWKGLDINEATIALQ